MKVVIPSTVTLAASNVPENDAAEWAADTIYAAGDVRMVSAVHRVYKALRTTVAGEYPPDSLLGTNPAWSDQGATVRHKMFDEYINTQTVAAGLLDVTIEASRCDAVGLFGCQGKSLILDLISGGVAIWSRSWTLLSPTYTYSEYCFGDRVFLRDVFTSIPIRGSSQLRIRIDAGDGGSAKCGIVVPGMAAYLGETQWDVTPGRISYSKKTTDDFGNTYLKKGNLAKSLKFKTTIETKEVDYVLKRLDAIDGVACIFVAYSDTGFQPESLLAYGFVREVQPSLPNARKSPVTFEVEGLI